MKKAKSDKLFNLILPSIGFGTVAGVSTAVVILVYKACAERVIFYSEKGYVFLREHLYFLPVLLAVLFGASFLLAWLYKKIPNIKGGGIPTSIALLRGLIKFKWLITLIGTFFASLLSFLIGVPLGTEGPSVQMGTSAGKGSTGVFGKKYRVWSRYSMTGGACAGFSAATGAPVSGILFSLEEAHQRMSPTIFIVSATSVAVSYIVSQLASVFFNIETRLFPSLSVISLSIKEIWLPAVIGILFGFFSLLFLKLYKAVSKLVSNTLKNVPDYLKVFSVFLFTVFAGIFSFSFISTGHALILEIMEVKAAIYMLILLLIVRSVLTILANTCSITGGIFLPIMAIGAVFAAIIARLATFVGVSEEYYTLILVIGIAACISGMMKMPLTAIVFSVEALSCYENIVPVVVSVVLAFVITEIFGADSITDSVLEHRFKNHNSKEHLIVIDTFVSVKEGSFAAGKQVRDILWPPNLFVLSINHGKKQGIEIDEHGSGALHTGDILHIRYSTCNEEETKEELTAIIGEQNYVESEDSVI